jgi:cytochrome c-type biogenesis protein CcmH/NrfF
MRTNALWAARLGLIVAGGVLIVASAKARALEGTPAPLMGVGAIDL